MRFQSVTAVSILVLSAVARPTPSTANNQGLSIDTDDKQIESAAHSQLNGREVDLDTITPRSPAGPKKDKKKTPSFTIHKDSTATKKKTKQDPNDGHILSDMSGDIDDDRQNRGHRTDDVSHHGQENRHRRSPSPAGPKKDKKKTPSFTIHKDSTATKKKTKQDPNDGHILDNMSGDIEADRQNRGHRTDDVSHHGQENRH